MSIRHGMLAAIAAVGLMLAGCGANGEAVAKLGERLAPQLLAVLGPTASALLGPEVSQILGLLQSRGASAVERAVDAKLAELEDRILRGEIATPEAAQHALDKASARMKLLRQLRKGNDYSQMVQHLSPADRARLDQGRAAVDARYVAVRVALADLGAVDPDDEVAGAPASAVVLAALSDVGQPSPAASSKPPPTWEQVIALCSAAIYGNQMARVSAELAAMPEGVRQSVMMVCAAYAEGVAAERGKVPAGAGVAI